MTKSPESSSPGLAGANDKKKEEEEEEEEGADGDKWGKKAFFTLSVDVSISHQSPEATSA